MQQKNALSPLRFNKNVVAELNNQELRATDSGSSPVCVLAYAAGTSSLPCGAAVVGAIVAITTN